MTAVLFDHRGQPVLFPQFLPHGFVRRQDPGADDRPVMVAAGVEKIVEIDGLMGAMEIADTEMDDAGRQIGLPVAGYSDVGWKLRQRAFGKFNSHRA